MGERAEQIQLATYGKLFSITRQAIINDDLDAFTRIPNRMGRAALRTVGDLVYAILTSNPNMSDGVALFHASHNNLLSASGITTSAVDAMRVAMGTQKDGKANLNIRLAHLLVPMALEGQANVVRDSQFEVGASAKNNTVPNSVRGTFDVVADSRLDTFGADKWFGTADGGIHDTIEVAYLDGNSMPVLEEQDGWKVDGVEFKVRMDAGVSALDYRTMAKNG
jgi:phage major head subunit gpT-like protein